MALRVFVGSASEAADVDREIRGLVEASGASVLGWRDLFRPGDYFLDALMRLETDVDGALLIVTPDDLTRYRGVERQSPRDNILLELGMLLTHFGKRRTGIVHVKAEPEAAVLPSDLSGVTTLVYQPGRPAQNETQLLRWLKGVAEEMEGEHPSLPRLYGLLRETFGSVPNSWRDAIDRYVVTSFMTTLSSALSLSAEP